MLTIFIFAAILGILVFVHEFGHFIVAFAWGLRPRLDNTRWFNLPLGRDAKWDDG